MTFSSAEKGKKSCLDSSLPAHVCTLKSSCPFCALPLYLLRLLSSTASSLINDHALPTICCVCFLQHHHPSSTNTFSIVILTNRTTAFTILIPDLIHYCFLLFALIISFAIIGWCINYRIVCIEVGGTI